MEQMDYILAGICDDDRGDLEALKQMLEEIFAEEKIEGEVHEYTNSAELFYILRQNPDKYKFLLLDVMIDDMTGIHLARYLRQVNGKANIIFVTNYPEFSFQGYYVAAARFLLKPVEKNKLKEAVLRLIDEAKKQPVFTFQTEEGEKTVFPKEIFYIELYGRKSKVCMDKEVFEVNESFSHLLKRMPLDNFALCHKSFLVNIKHIAGIQRYNITLSNKKHIPVSKKQYNEIRGLLLHECFH